MGVLALCKFMCLSERYCAQHMQLLLQLLRNARSTEIKNNIIIAFGDLLHRWPNTVTKYSKEIFLK